MMQPRKPLDRMVNFAQTRPLCIAPAMYLIFRGALARLHDPVIRSLQASTQTSLHTYAGMYHGIVSETRGDLHHAVIPHRKADAGGNAKLTAFLWHATLWTYNMYCEHAIIQDSIV